MAKPEEPRRLSGAGLSPALTLAPASANASQRPQAHPQPPPVRVAYKSPPPNAVLMKVSKSTTPLPSSNLAHAPSGSPATIVDPRPSVNETATPSPAPVQVPAQCWYANPFSLSTNTPMTEFHRSMRGKVLFSARAVPVTASELLSLPQEKPSQLTICEIGKDLLYGVGYLYNTPLSVEHQWRGRVAHLLRVRSQREPIPSIVRRRAEALAALQQRQQQRYEGKNAGNASEKLPKRVSPSSADLPQSPASPLGNKTVPIDYRRTMVYERGEASVYDRPCDDLLLGIKLYVNDELVDDHYPIVNALPQCTATLAVKEATQHWNCVPFVLIGYLNQLMLDPICVYHALSLNFAEHLLRIKTPASTTRAKASAAAVEAPTDIDPKSAPPMKPPAFIDLSLRVEVVYGCRAESFYCTEFISRGACTLRMTELSKPALKSYEEKLRALVRLRLAAPQLIARVSNGVPPPRHCSGCGYPMQYQCTVCGADVCGMPMCATKAAVGYPRACTKHVLPPNQQN
ncbi:hypothetical protein ABL78_1421 [Leptomonas seymouri]|uniref:Uncharacterized protein n=1 Tax=Leptomonas seymouri TaxID=5684 RepID=A0A0N0P8F3_LEPSE|nr:hypothetical protein ABL78_1421 [Leptomonas seymouri]|eukprot:KPI89457.1 hypothetical protein ABL78_1421 [Leptomonas seymouri]